MEHESSILYGPVNALWHSVQHRYAWDVPDHVIGALLVLAISSIVFPLATRNLSRDNPGGFQQILEMVVDGLRALLHDVIGHGAERFLYIIGGFATFIFLCNIFGEHTATGIFMGLVPLIVPWPMMGLGIFGALLQTFVFIMLTMVYISGATAVEEH